MPELSEPQSSNNNVKVLALEEQWNFNGNDPLPWQDLSVPRFEGVRQFARCDDRDLFDYLSHRRIAHGFLVEIDMFLRSHSEIVKYAPKFIKLINSLPPLEAYLYFLRGYTRPARYLDGIIKSEGLTLSPMFRPASISTKRDKELDDFFEGFDYRYDILDRIDAEVMYACDNIRHGRFVSRDLRRLVCYAIYGHPVDAYKFYEYNYQQEYMPHRYLPEHVVLGEIPKPLDYREPAPSSVLGFKKHRDIRYHMAQAKDQGVGELISFRAW
ncbi:hypothetical protein K491DRAFT_600915 [Lophiostoma macrostomum CBS 122681]|uniref:Uncharacterized protein n=1 Tax=Lophiostoma macrostomum CBS 122681 TaxID=1314788 RepID=A0A6A6T323_9PLEO|nr:hypothetical protein K491DRAFT_600915 [Lophiostoma macrostomum CBS 122681]